MSLPQLLFGKVADRGSGRRLCLVVYPDSLTTEEVLEAVPDFAYNFHY